MKVFSSKKTEAEDFSEFLLASTRFGSRRVARILIMAPGIGEIDGNRSKMSNCEKLMNHY